MELQEIILARKDQNYQLQQSLLLQCESLQENLAKAKLDLTEYKSQAHYWESQFKKFKGRESDLISELEETKAALRKREQQLFGRRSEKNTKKPDVNPNLKEKPSSKKRGQQKGSKGHCKRTHDNLPINVENCELSNNNKLCTDCGESLLEMSNTEDSSLIEIINVKAYKRIIKRKRYKCTCECNKKTTTAPGVSKLYPKATLGVSVWSYLLLKKYAYHIPLNRSINILSANGLSLAAGTITDGFKKLIPLLTPIYDQISLKSLTAKHWHADETGWKVFENIEGKKNNRWFMWIYHNDETVIYRICPSRAAKEISEHFGENHAGGILNVDRYSAYKAISKKGLFLLAYCWAHVRRDFLSYAKGYPNDETWGLSWIDEIALLYHINNERIKHKPSTTLFKESHEKLKKQVEIMSLRLESELNDKSLFPGSKKVLTSLKNHWSGLIVFVDEHSIPMDNNKAERGLRGPVIGRNGYYGSGAVWSSSLSAILFSIFKTMELAGINQHTWLLSYLNACADNGGKPPENIDSFLPWNMNEEAKKLFSLPPSGEDPQ